MFVEKVFLFSGVGESIQDLWFLGQPTDLQHHQGGGALCVLCRHDRVAGIQTQTLQDQVQMRMDVGVDVMQQGSLLNDRTEREHHTCCFWHRERGGGSVMVECDE